MIPEEGVATENPSGVKKLVFCSGKVYYDLKKARNEKNLEKDIAIARVEQVLFLYNSNVAELSIVDAFSHQGCQILGAFSNLLPHHHLCVCLSSLLTFEPVNEF